MSFVLAPFPLRKLGRGVPSAAPDGYYEGPPEWPSSHSPQFYSVLLELRVVACCCNQFAFILLRFGKFLVLVLDKVNMLQYAPCRSCQSNMTRTKDE